MNKDVQKYVKKLLREGFRLDQRGGKRGSVILVGPAGGTLDVENATDYRRIQRWADGQRHVVEAVGVDVVEAARKDRTHDRRDAGGVLYPRELRSRSLKAVEQIERAAPRLLPDDRDRLLRKLGWK